MSNLSFNMDVDWLSPVSEADPSGKSMEYDSKFAELETAAIATPEQQYGDTVISGKEPDWSQMLKLATELSQQTKDLRILLWMTRAVTQLYGLIGTLYVLRQVNLISLQFWESLHPQLMIDDELDPLVRFSALSNFNDTGGLTADIRQSVVLTSQLGAFTVKDLERLIDNGALDVDGVMVTENQLARIVDDVRASDNADSLDVPAQIIHDINAIQLLYQERLGSEFQPDFSALLRPLKKILRLLEPNVRTSPSTDRDKANASASPSESSTSGSINDKRQSLQYGGAIQTRRDAQQQLELACRYLEIHEPTNPAPFLIRRAIKVMEMNFMDILKDMAPEGLTQASFITGVSSPSNDK